MSVVGCVLLAFRSRDQFMRMEARPRLPREGGRPADSWSSRRSRAGRRGLGLPDPSVERQHRIAQAAEGDVAAKIWEEGDWVFAKHDGNPRTAHNRWKALLRKAGVRDARLHDARHTAATMLLLLGVPERGHGHDGVVAHSHGHVHKHMTEPIRPTSPAGSVG